MRLLIHLKLQLERKLLYMYTADRGIFYIPAYNRDGHAMHSKALIFPEGLISVDLALVNCV